MVHLAAGAYNQRGGVGATAELQRRLMVQLAEAAASSDAATKASHDLNRRLHHLNIWLIVLTGVLVALGVVQIIVTVRS